MPQTLQERVALSLIHTPGSRRVSPEAGGGSDRRGFGGARAPRGARRKGAAKRSAALSKDDWGPLGKHPDLEAVIARQRLGLPRSGRLSAAEVSQAWKRCAAQHHPDRGGAHDTMLLVNGARDRLLGRGLG